MIVIRDATPEELARIIPYERPGYETWCGVAVEDGGRLHGHICISYALGQFFGHDTRVDSEDATVALRLWRFARAKARSLGATEISVHFTENDGEIMKFWISHGFEPVPFVVYRGAI